MVCLNLNGTFFVKGEMNLLIFRLNTLMFIFLDAGFSDSYWISAAVWSQKNNILHFLADFDNYNVMNRELHFRSLTVYGTPNCVSMKLNLGLSWIDGDIQNNLWCGLLLFLHGQVFYLVLIYFPHINHKSNGGWCASTMAAMQITRVVTISPYVTFKYNRGRG